MKDWRKRPRRRHSQELKAQVLAQCAQPGASVAAVALAHGLNANVVHKWRRMTGEAATPLASFIPVALPAPAAVQQDIRMELRRGTTTMTIVWPSAAAAECAAWMRELLR
ncbi:IS66-like element accessory protein TnpA [Caenimonas koreensis]|uniref:Transposase n=1 Tax=Caenimonas koreensis DSM 17982 TaxID=1121255 RepID=A0A844B6W4_9BURK|nr:transposase [Caenimonas koreensis]MRD48923.1 transposase [Caenimonas koreensis DSM 17982]